MKTGIVIEIGIESETWSKMETKTIIENGTGGNCERDDIEYETGTTMVGIEVNSKMDRYKTREFNQIHLTIKKKMARTMLAGAQVVWRAGKTISPAPFRPSNRLAPHR
ncbi:hypothetical protein EVAR_93075_1 [Eumeta japonica]|uniref:Uncharacterized protein n=1 Tax=Eumeta variegata TaxID=151549 RepID=A0A4C1TI90_EUMVA|nr:hypothetical protein EVAR_93075_1 [Eumeta japonica]